LAIGPSTAFVSYSREDSDFALRLAEDLKAAGASVWLDQLDIVPGQRWDRAVEDALASCPRMLVILSPASVNSTNVMDEVSFALEEKKAVIPVIYKDCMIPFRLRRVQYVDFRKDYARGLKELLKTLNPQQSTPAISDAPRLYQVDTMGTDKGERAAEEEWQKAEAQKAGEEAEARERTEAERKVRQEAEEARWKASVSPPQESPSPNQTLQPPIEGEVKSSGSSREASEQQPLAAKAHLGRPTAERIDIPEEKRPRKATEEVGSESADSSVVFEKQKEERHTPQQSQITTEKPKEEHNGNQKKEQPSVSKDKSMIGAAIGSITFFLICFLLVIVAVRGKHSQSYSPPQKSDYETRLDNASDLANRGDLDGAIAAYRELLRLTESREAHARIGKLLEQKGDKDGAIVEYRQVVGDSGSPGYFAETFKLLGLYFLNNDVDAAYALAQRAVQRWPQDDTAHFYLAWAMGQKKDVDGAIAEYREAIKLNPKEAASHNNLGSELEQKGDLQGALLEYQAAVALDPKDNLYKRNLNRLSQSSVSKRKAKRE